MCSPEPGCRRSRNQVHVVCGGASDRNLVSPAARTRFHCPWLVRRPRIRVGREGADALRELAARQIGERDVLQHTAQAGPNGDPDVAQRLRAPLVDHLLRADAADVRERPVNRADHVREAHLGGGSCKPVAAVGAAPAGDDPGVPEIGEDVLEEVRRDLLRLGDPFALDRPVTRRGQLDRRPDRIVRLGRDPHAAILPGRLRRTCRAGCGSRRPRETRGARGSAATSGSPG